MLTEETKATNRRNDPDCESHCGCGVPFTMDCSECKAFLGDEYQSPDQGTEKKERRGAMRNVKEQLYKA